LGEDCSQDCAPRERALAQMEAVIFDFDFTLADSSKPIAECVTQALHRLGFTAPTPMEIAGTIGLSLEEMFRRLTGQTNSEWTREFVRYFHACADQIMEGATRMYDSVEPLMRNLRDARIRAGIVTTKLNYRIRNILVANGLLEFFDVIVGADDVERMKPDPEGLLLALRRLETAPVSAVYVGDHIIDAQAARDAGIPFIAVLSGRHSRGAFEAFPSIAIVESIRDLQRVLRLGAFE
jgi:phosphoglycolate phosphatase